MDFSIFFCICESQSATLCLYLSLTFCVGMEIAPLTFSNRWKRINWQTNTYIFGVTRAFFGSDLYNYIDLSVWDVKKKYFFFDTLFAYLQCIIDARWKKTLFKANMWDYLNPTDLPTRTYPFISHQFMHSLHSREILREKNPDFLSCLTDGNVFLLLSSLLFWMNYHKHAKKIILKVVRSRITL